MKKNKIVFSTILSVALMLSMSVCSFAGEWKQTDNYWYFENSDGSHPSGGMYVIDNSPYIFDNNGILLTSKWVQVSSGEWVYCKGDGNLAKDQWVGNYYCGSDYTMATNTVTPDGYNVGADGKLVSNLQA